MATATNTTLGAVIGSTALGYCAVDGGQLALNGYDYLKSKADDMRALAVKDVAAKSDLAADVQASLGKADTAVQPAALAGKQDTITSPTSGALAGMTPAQCLQYISELLGGTHKDIGLDINSVNVA
jgi:hypothetical protein